MVILQLGSKEESQRHTVSQLEMGQNLETHTHTLSHCLSLLLNS